MNRDVMEACLRAYESQGFNNLFCITNNPVGRFGDFLIRSDNFVSYMKKLYAAFNPAVLENMMCRFQVSVGYDGSLYDCDFNQAAAARLRLEKTERFFYGGI